MRINGYLFKEQFLTNPSGENYWKNGKYLSNLGLVADCKKLN